MNQVNNNTQQNHSTNPFSEDIIKEWGLSKLSPEEQADMIERIGRLIYQALLVRGLDLLTEEEQTELDLLLDEDTTTPQDVLHFLEVKIPTFEVLRQEEILKLKRDILVSEK